MSAAPRRAAPQPAARPRPTGTGRAAPVGAPGRSLLLRWLRVALLVAFVLVGLPLAHALWGEAAALLGGAALLGFLLGRWTAPG